MWQFYFHKIYILRVIDLVIIYEASNKVVMLTSSAHDPDVWLHYDSAPLSCW